MLEQSTWPRFPETGRDLPMARMQAFAALLVTTLLSPFSPTAVHAQQATIAGTVTDLETAAPVSDAAIRVLGREGATAVTDAAGEFRVSVPAGTHSIVVTRIGYETSRTDGLTVEAGATVPVNIQLRSRALALNQLVVTVSRREEKELDAPASISTLSGEQISRMVARTPADHIRTLPGVDLATTGITQSYAVVRGFNNVASGRLLSIVDNRYARIPALRINAINMIPTTDMDIERIELARGPGAALYGPNAAEGVMHIITWSPIDKPGSTVSLAGGERSVFQFLLRSAHRVSERFGLKVSGQYLRGNDWEYTDPIEVAARGQNPGHPRIGVRNPLNERYFADVRADHRFGDDGELILSGGLNNSLSSINLTTIGSSQTHDWQYRYAQARLIKGRLFGQFFLNQTHSGDNSYLLRSGELIVDRSRTMAAQLQHGRDIGERQTFTFGVDWQRTEPRSEGTIYGRNEDHDLVVEAGVYIHSESRLTERVDLVTAFRVDTHNQLGRMNVSPRAALVFRPSDGRNLRLTYNRAFVTPGTSSLFLDIPTGQLPIAPGIAYTLRAFGVPASGLTFAHRCEDGFGEYCMRSPFMPGQLPANASLFWDALVAAFVPEALRAYLLEPGSRPGDPALETVLRLLNPEALGPDGGELFPAIPRPEDLPRLVPTVFNTIEAGYKGLHRDRIRLAADLYGAHVENFVGALQVETPNVFLDPATTGAFLATRLAALIQAGVVTAEQVAEMTAGLASVPVGTVVPDQVESPDLLLASRNFGSATYWGADFSAQILATDRVSLTAGYSFQSTECFDFDEDDECPGSRDLALNAPSHKGSLAVAFTDRARGFHLDGRWRFSDGFDMRSGVFAGPVDAYQVLDLTAGYQLPFQPNTRLELTVYNALNNLHREFVGAPELGRLALMRVKYDF
ncbi:MAG: TonB-dependent receptor [Gemmatimonadetes bacterium]|nr:TonB-dependent receptor [Gemmatimonadota bacterium]MYK67123.1 TonB-dependent receptor [Gemmatimonadota bacterium]